MSVHRSTFLNFNFSNKLHFIPAHFIPSILLAYQRAYPYIMVIIIKPYNVCNVIIVEPFTDEFLILFQVLKLMVYKMFCYKR